MDKIFDTVQTIYKMISIESWEMERMNYCRGAPVVVSAGWLHEAGAAENKDVIHEQADNLQRDTWGRQPLGERRGGWIICTNTAHGDKDGTFDCWFVQYWSVPQEMFFLD